MIEIQLDMFEKTETLSLMMEIQKLRRSSEAQRKCLFGMLNNLAEEVKELRELKLRLEKTG